MIARFRRSDLRSAEGLLSGPKPEARDLAIELLLSAVSRRLDLAAEFDPKRTLMTLMLAAAPCPEAAIPCPASIGSRGDASRHCSLFLELGFRR
jgi:hypothetical protein